MTNTPECDYDNGDCCGPDVRKLYCNDCDCIQGNTTFTRKYAGETFTHLLEECIETNPEIDLNYLMSKFDPNILIQVSVIKDGKVVQDIRHETTSNITHQTDDKIWQSIFHPQYGHCHSFDLKNIDPYKYLPAGYEILFRMRKPYRTFLHEANEMANEFSSYISPENWAHQKIRLKKKTVSMPKPILQRLPCSQNEFFTCIDQQFHLVLAEEFGCKVSILYSGIHLGRNYNKSLPDCPNHTIYKVL